MDIVHHFVAFANSHSLSGHDPATYPVKAIHYVLAHPTLWKPIIKAACWSTAITFLVWILFMAFAWKPQSLLIGTEWWSWALGFLLVLSETAVVAFLLLLVSQARAQSEIFVLTMQLENKWNQEKMHSRPFHIYKTALVVRILTYPLNVFPFVGNALYSLINSTFMAWDYMDLYFYALGMDRSMQRLELLGKANRSAVLQPSTYSDSNPYTRFGFVCAFLETVPLVGWTVFPLTNACATALFACDIEDCGGPERLRSMMGTDQIK